MGSPHYTQTGAPQLNRRGSSQTIRKEFKLIEDGLDAMAEFYIPIFVFNNNFSVQQKIVVYVPDGWKFTALGASMVASAAAGGYQSNIMFRTLSGQGLNTSNRDYWYIQQSFGAGSKRTLVFDKNNTDLTGMYVDCRRTDEAAPVIPVSIVIKCKRTQ